MDENSQQSSSSCDSSITNKEKCSELDFSERTWKEDFTLIVEGEKLYVSKAILAFASPVFDRMFQSEFREKDQAELNLPGKKVREMRDFLRFIYPCMDECISDENVYKLLPLAEEYQVTSLKAKCKRFLISRLNKELKAEDTKMMLQTALIYNMEDLLVKLCEELPEHSARDIISANILLPSKIVPKILDKLLGRLDQVREQKTLYKGIYNYLKSGYTRTEQQYIEINQGWKCKSIHLKLNVDDLMKHMKPQTKKLKFLESEENCTVSDNGNNTLNQICDMPQTKKFKSMNFDGNCTISVYRNYGEIYVDISFDKHTLEKSEVTVHGRFVIRNVTYENENYKSTFEMKFRPHYLKQTAKMANTSDLFTKTAGYMHYNSIDAEVHLLAKIQEV
ncbi:uncharacterized protein LOC132746577 [Ruditapes philippinarum]|uniref:uncharacterized protein LOC132746577 n=1 Tax=Ruditapes philippinarum TaxID=129788 RepID=UPI00295A60DC|nr:uncharacterized protein LOC132746577 [Ruditapes philippinarum]